MIFQYSDDEAKRYHSWNYALRQQFGGKIFKVPVDGGFDCPNRDGTVAHGGCTFCSVSGSGDMIVAPSDPLPQQFLKEIDMMQQKWPHVAQYFVYFQICTSTEARGELGLQTTYESTSEKINRAHDYPTYVDAVARLRKHNINVCTHLINGLPGESLDMMRENVRRTILDSDIQGIKLHLLHLMRNTKMLRDYAEGRLQLMSKDDYVSVICDQLEMIPQDIIIHRLTGDAPWDSLIGPMWSLKKWEVLNAIDQELIRRDSYQGKFALRKDFIHVANGSAL